MFLGDTILLIDGNEHFERRRMESELFDRSALQYYESHALRPVVNRIMSGLKADTDGLVHADLVDITRTALYRISASVTGIDGVDEVESTQTFVDWVNLLGEASTVQWSTRPRCGDRGRSGNSAQVLRPFSWSFDRTTTRIATAASCGNNHEARSPSGCDDDFVAED